MRTFSVLFSAPTTLIMAQVFIYTEVGAYGVALTGIIISSLVILFILSYYIAKYGLLKNHHYNIRTTFNVEVTTQLKQFKALGWSDLITEKNR